MSDAANNPAEAGGSNRKGGKVTPLLFGLILATAGAAGGYFAAVSGLVGVTGERSGKPEDRSFTAHTAFVDIDPMIISIQRPGGLSQLRLKVSLEVAESKADAVADLMPRLLDVLNSYLRAVDTIDISDAATLVRLRAQMLRRIQIVAGENAVKDLLIQEFVVN